MIIVPIGGGSGACGCALVRSGLGSSAKVIGVQAERADAFARSWRGPSRVVGDKADTFAEGMATRVTFDLTFEILKKELDDLVTLDRRGDRRRNSSRAARHPQSCRRRRCGVVDRGDETPRSTRRAKSGLRDERRQHRRRNPAAGYCASWKLTTLPSVAARLARTPRASSVASACRCWCFVGSGDNSQSALVRWAACGPTRARTLASAEARCRVLQEPKVRIEGDLAERDDDTDVRQGLDFAGEMRRAVG